MMPLGASLRTITSLLALVPLAGGAAEFPSRPIRLVVPYAVGGATDITSRIIGPRMGESMGQQIVVDNRPGGASMIGTEMVARANPDGYTIMLASIAFGANPSLFRKIPYDTAKAFAPVSLVATLPTVLTVHPTLPARSVAEFLALAKAKPGALNYASAGNGSANHLAMELFSSMTGTRVVHVPYKGGGPAVADLVAGQIPILFATVTSAIPHIKSGRLFALGVSSLKRNVALPDVPSIAELVPGYEMFEWQGFVVPTGTPNAIVDRLHRETVKVLALPDVRERIAGLGADVIGSSPRELGVHIAAELARWAKVAKEGGIQVVD